jgi:hypothetical protein
MELSESIPPLKPTKPGMPLVHCKGTHNWDYVVAMNKAYMIKKMKYKEELLLWETRLSDLIKPEVAYANISIRVRSC